LVIFEVGSCFLPWPAWSLILLFMLPCIAGMAGARHHTQPLVEMGCCEIPPSPGLELICSRSVPTK
jgi:hypothetical protein